MQRVGIQWKQPKPKRSGCGENENPSPTFIPYPVGLVDLERRKVLSQNQLSILMMRRFADPRTGVWHTSTLEVARLLRIARSTVQKALRKLERDKYLHLRDHRGGTVRRDLFFGGFPRPEHEKLGLPPLRWDRGFTDPATAKEQKKKQSTPVENSNRPPDSRFVQPKNGGAVRRESTVLDSTYNELTNDNDNNDEPKDLFENDSTNDDHDPKLAVNSAGGAVLTPVAQFQPKCREESIVRDLARNLGEENINSFLALYRRYGLDKFQRACGQAKEKLHDRMNPLRRKPGAYVRWLLQNGKV